MRLEELRRLERLLAGATGPADVFMSLRDRSLRGDARSLGLANEVRRLQANINPERFMGNPPAQDLARELGARLEALHRQALVLLAAIADEPAPATQEVAEVAEVAEVPEPAPEPTSEGRGFVVIAGPNRYRLDEQVGDGDVAAIYRGVGVEGAHAGVEVAAKVALDRADNGFIFAEMDALRRLHASEGRQRHQVPRLLDRFESGEGHAGVVLPWIEGLDGVALRARFPAGLAPEHGIWIGRRLLSVAGFAHQLGVLHANIEPANVIVRPRDHHVTLIDWCWCVVEPGRTRQGFRVHNPDFSAPEVAEKKPPLPAADLYSIGRCMLYFVGGDLASGAMPAAVDDRLQRFIRYLTRPSPLQRAQDAWEMFGELERVRTAIYGAHRFIELVV